MRTVNLNFVGDEAYQDFAVEHPAEVLAAIGYLALWGNSDICNITYHNEEFVAVYREWWHQDAKPHPKPTFVLGAIWREDSQSFSFHS